MRRDYLFWGTVLILLGGLMFLNNADIRLPGGLNPMALFWPSVLILLGGWIMFGYFLRGKVAEERISIDLQGATQASLKLSHGAGRIVVGAGNSVGAPMPICGVVGSGCDSVPMAGRMISGTSMRR